ncbi:DUF2490 domain-containing protein [Neolewinella antarctica]|uniref:DUF2490 domain-containing protein n=1 Tax=Neolewinella antarctica TaxID=442734 RepID=A0ABX0X6R9_9BACT|nr:DUF2490 domain-containing protein [Neolewinella antarctica]NJC24718.1 hypothetical protein [Neolewinella antarctica]
MKFLFLTLLTLPLHLFSQSEIWHGVDFEHEVTENWGYDLAAEYRRNANQAAEGTYYLMVGGNYQVWEAIDVTVAGRYEIERGGGQEFRLFTDLNYARDLPGPFKFSTRTRFQKDFPIGADGSGQQVAVRQRLGLSANLTESFKVVVDYESRYRFDRRNEWSRNRYTAGLDWAVTAQFALQAFFRIDSDINEGPRKETYTYGLYADFVLPDGRLRKWKYRRPFGRRLRW